jgi:hypothetical protein
VVEVYEGIVGPEFVAEILPCHQFAGTSQQEYQNLEGLFLQTDFRPVFAQLSGSNIYLKNTESKDLVSTGRRRQRHIVMPRSLAFIALQ